MDGQFLVSQ